MPRTTAGLKRGGQRGRPKGSKNKATPEIKIFWREFFESEAYRENAKFRMIQGKAPHLESYLLMLVFGKPRESIDLDAHVTGAVRIVHEYHDSPVDLPAAG